MKRKITGFSYQDEGLNPLQEVGVMKPENAIDEIRYQCLNPLQEVGVMKLKVEELIRNGIVLIPFRKSG